MNTYMIQAPISCADVMLLFTDDILKRGFRLHVLAALQVQMIINNTQNGFYTGFKPVTVSCRKGFSI